MNSLGLLPPCTTTTEQVEIQLGLTIIYSLVSTQNKYIYKSIPHLGPLQDTKLPQEGVEEVAKDVLRPAYREVNRVWLASKKKRKDRGIAPE